MELQSKLIFEDTEIDKISLRVQGISMEPFLKDGRDIVNLRREKNFKKGDIVVFRYNGNYVMHRIIEINGNRFNALGDNLSYPEKDVPVNDIVFKVESVIRNNKPIKTSSPLWIFFSKIYIRMPLRRIFRKLFRIGKKIKEGK